jgi:nickel-dependent lactate racemase
MEKAMGVPVVSSMEVACVGTLADGMPVYCDTAALSSNGIVVVNRVMPHTDFKGSTKAAF